MDAVELAYLPATELAQLIRTKAISPVEVVETLLARVEQVNPKLNALCTVTAEQARDDARRAEAAVMRGDELGPLHGVPVTIKDLVTTKGVRTTRGSYLYEDYVPDEDAPIVERLKAAGAINLGKNTTPEFGWKGVTESPLWGVTRNPWNVERTSGGSSGGAAAAVAAGLGPLAIGTDAGGSIRIPAGFCGIYGLKPSLARIPMYPPSPAEMISHSGPMTRTVRDAALLLNVLAGPDERDRQSLPADGTDYLAACDRAASLGGLRIAWSADLGYAPVDPEVRALCEVAARRFTELGAEVEDAKPGFDDPIEIFNVYFYGSIGALLIEKLPEWEPKLDPGLVKVIREGQLLSAFDFARANFKRAALWDTVRRFFSRYDLLLTPTLPIDAFEVGRNFPKAIGDQPAGRLSWTPFTYPFNLTGQPAATVPCGWTSDGLPVGLQIVGRRYADATVIRASAAFEAIEPWADRRPPV